MTKIENLSRRNVLKAIAASPFVLGAGVPSWSPIAQANAETSSFAPNLFVALAPTGQVTIIVSRSEMGTGIRTSLAMVLADELDADWRAVRVMQAQGDTKYGDQNTDGSKSVRLLLNTMRESGAAARHMLVAAAAKRWDVAPSACHTEAGFVVLGAAGTRLSYGDLAVDAANMPVPLPETVTMKSPSAWRYIGKPIPILDLDDIVLGKAVYGIDVTLPNMKYASIERPPSYGGSVKRFDATEAMKVPGVEHVIEIPSSPLPSGFLPLGGVAVIATNTWAAMQGRQKLNIQWEPGPNADYDTTSYRAALEATARQPGKVVRENGDVDSAMQSASKRISADYFVPHLSHATMEPEASTAIFADGKCTVWTATQNPQQARTTVAQFLGIGLSNVTINVTLLGGGFGRKSKPDYVAESAFLARAAGAPVKVTWTREDDLAHDYYHAIAAQHLEAGLDGDGKAVAWLHRSVFPSIGSTFTAGTVYGAPGELSQGVVDMPFDIPNVRCENGRAEPHVRIGWYRSVYNIPHAFAVGSFVDEMAVAADQDPVHFLLTLLGEPRRLDTHLLGSSFVNYGASVDDYPIDIGRMRNVVGLVAARSNWSSPLPARHGRGIAVHRSFLTYVAAVAHVAVAADGTVTVERVDVAVDCGMVVHPERVAAQFEGAVVMSLGNTLFSNLTFKQGRAEQSNFGDYQVTRIDAVPETHVHVVRSDAPPGGVGEPGVPPVSAAICNAIFNAVGVRVRALPVDPSQLKAA
jgi:isoquinoline 1-oxidoreductase beta subunit